MNPEMTLVEAMKKIDYLNGQMTVQAIMSALVFIFLCCVIVFLSRRNNRLNEECRRLEYSGLTIDKAYRTEYANAAQIQHELTTTIARLKSAEATIERLQGVKVGRPSIAPPEIHGGGGFKI